MPFIPNLPESLSDAPGVDMLPPPDEYFAQTQMLIADAVKNLQPGETGRLAWIATTKGINLAVVNRFEGDRFDFTISGWIGKEWGQPMAAGIVGGVSW